MCYGLRFFEELDRGRFDMLRRLIGRLSLEPRSMYRAVAHFGDPKWLGWGHEARLLTDLWDAVIYDVQASGVNKKARYKQVAPRPEPKKQTRIVSSRDNVAAALAGLRG